MLKLVLGLGCDRDTAIDTIVTAIADALASMDLTMDDVQAVASIDKKSDEVGLLDVCKKYGWDITFYSAGQLAKVDVPNPSDVVMRYVGTPSVGEAAAILKTGGSKDDLIVEKYKYKGTDGKNATVSICIVRNEMSENADMNISASSRLRGEGYGKILLVGFGPGGEEQMTYRARAAIEEADVVIGYTTYIKLVRDLLDGKEVIRKGMTEEIDRCVEAYEAAKQGQTVALISSGDVGVYGMAGPTYEVLLQHGWTPDSDIQVEVVPGTTALNACASLVGAPLTHDFCSISLSDLLTPWTTIRKRIDAVGAADFVIALYNPKSGRRTQQIVEAQRILLQHRDAKTPVAIVKSAYRRRQNIQMTTLDQMADCDIGMLTTVMIGNSSSYVKEGLLITPRGYANKYDALTGGAKAGEQSGRSLTMGLDGWHGCVRRWLEAGNHKPWEQIAQHFDAPLGEILTAVAGASSEEPAGGYQAGHIDAEKLDQLLDSLPQWGRLRAVIRAPGGAVSECLLNGDQFELKGDWLNCVTDAFHVHVNWARVDHAYIAKRGAKSMGVHFLGATGDLVFRLLLVRDGDEFNGDAVAGFEQSWKELA